MSDTQTPDGALCGLCGAFGLMPHLWVEGQCVLPHRNHSKATIGFCCSWCVDRWREWLTEVVELFAGLFDVLEPGSIPDDTAEHGHVKKQPASPAPVRLEAWSMLFDTDRLYQTGRNDDLPDVPGVLVAHVDRLWEDLDYGAFTGTTVSSAAAALSTNLALVAAGSWVDEFDAELRWIRQSLRRAHGLSDPKPLGACLTIDCTGLVWRDRDGGQPKCAACSRRYGLHDIVRLKANERATA